MATALSIPATAVTGVRVLPRVPLAWTLVFYRNIFRDKLHVLYLSSETGAPRDAALDCWLDYDMDSKPYRARVAWFPPDMDDEIRDLLRADLFAYWTGESVDWMEASREQMKAVLP